jgi:outer membrane lipoprotein-sorting protein
MHSNTSRHFFLTGLVAQIARTSRPLRLICLALLWPVLASAAALDLDPLMKALAKVGSGEATFIEKRFVAQLDAPLESSGRLSFTAPDAFVRDTLKPRRERIAVTGNTLVMSQGSRSRTVQLDATPEAGVIVEAVRGTLSGNRAVLERHFTVQAQGSLERWQLDLVPRDARMRAQVTQIRVVGQQARLREVTVMLADGDRSVMTITTVEPSAVPAPAPAPAPAASVPAPAATSAQLPAAAGASSASAAGADAAASATR